MQLCFDHDAIVETTGGYASSINGNSECLHQTIKNMVNIQLISYGYRSYLWCFCYQYIIWILYCIINWFLGTSPIDDWYKYINISYTIPFTELLLWGCNIYIIKSNQGKKVLYPRTNIYPCDCPPDVDPSIITTSEYGSFI